MVSSEFFLPLRLLGSFFHIAMNGNAAADKIFRLLDEITTETSKIHTRKEVENSTVELCDISFSYEKEKPVLKNINIKAGKGMTAIVGESGCGKSTIMSLLMGEILPEDGKIRIGGIEQFDIHKNVLYQKITRIRHDSYIFAGTIKENLLMGKPGATDTEMFDVLKQVNLFEFIYKNGGLEMKVLEKASNLSGGQKQRLALARALLHDTDIYLFDEATSNVDVESENDIMSVVKQLAKKKTVILISHRLANVIQADCIYVMKDGAIIEAKNHENLYLQKGYYHKLFTQQKTLEQYGKEEIVYES